MRETHWARAPSFDQGLHSRAIDERKIYPLFIVGCNYPVTHKRPCTRTHMHKQMPGCTPGLNSRRNICGHNSTAPCQQRGQGTAICSQPEYWDEVMVHKMPKVSAHDCTWGVIQAVRGDFIKVNIYSPQSATENGGPFGRPMQEAFRNKVC